VLALGLCSPVEEIGSDIAKDQSQVRFVLELVVQA